MIKINVWLNWLSCCSFIYDMFHIQTTSNILGLSFNGKVTVTSHTYKTFWKGIYCKNENKGKWMEWLSVFSEDGYRPTDIWIRNYLLTFLRPSLLAIIKLFMAFLNTDRRGFCFAYRLSPCVYRKIHILLYFFFIGNI